LPETYFDKSFIEGEMDIVSAVKEILGSQLQLMGRVDSFTHDTQLLGEMPEFDSMAVGILLTAIEEEFGVSVDDDEIDAEVFQTVGSSADFIENKVL